MAKRYSQEWRDNISKSKMGHSVSEEVREILSKCNLGRKLSEEHKRKISDGIRGDKNPMKKLEARLKISLLQKGEKSMFWKGGVSAPNEIARKSMEYRLWRESVFKRDNYTCQQCGLRGGCGKKVVLNADHIKPFSLYPDLRYAIGNGRTLCVDCHKKTPTYGKNRRNSAVEYLSSLIK